MSLPSPAFALRTTQEGTGLEELAANLAGLEEAIEKLIADLASPDRRVRERALVRLRERGPETVVAVPSLIHNLADPALEVSTYGVISTLQGIGPAAIQPLAHLAREDSDEEVRVFSVWALGFMGPAASAQTTEVLEAIRNNSKETDRVRDAAKVALHRNARWAAGLEERVLYDQPVSIRERLSDPMPLFHSAVHAGASILTHLERQGYLRPEILSTELTARQTIEGSLLPGIMMNSVEAIRKKWESSGYVGAEIRIRGVIKNGKLWFQVLDNGPGLPAEVQVQVGNGEVTTKNTQGSDANFKITGGSGRHLYVTSNLSEKLGWEFEIENLEDTQGNVQGASVSLGLPLPSLTPPVASAAGLEEVERGSITWNRPGEPPRTFRIVTEAIDPYTILVKLYEGDQPVGSVKHSYLSYVEGGRSELDRVDLQPRYRRQGLNTVLLATFFRAVEDGILPNVPRDIGPRMKVFVLHPMLALSLQHFGFRANPYSGDQAREMFDVTVGQASPPGDLVPVYLEDVRALNRFRLVTSTSDWDGLTTVDERPSPGQAVPIFAWYSLPTDQIEVFRKHLSEQPLIFTWYPAAPAAGPSTEPALSNIEGLRTGPSTRPPASLRTGLEEGLTPEERALALSYSRHRLAGGRLRLTGEKDVERIFGLQIGEPPLSVPSVPRELFRDKDVLVVPAYGSLPFSLKEWGARRVLGIDKDPVTVAWQKARALYGKDPTVAARLKLSDDPERRGAFPIALLRTRIRDRTAVSESRVDGVWFAQGDLTQTLPVQDGEFDFVVVPYLLGVQDGIEDISGYEKALRELLRVTRPGGTILILPWQPSNSMPTLQRFHEFAGWLSSQQGRFTFSASRPFLLEDFTPFPILGHYALLTKPQAGSSPSSGSPLRTGPSTRPPASLRTGLEEIRRWGIPKELLPWLMSVVPGWQQRGIPYLLIPASPKAALEPPAGQIQWEVLLLEGKGPEAVAQEVGELLRQHSESNRIYAVMEGKDLSDWAAVRIESHFLPHQIRQYLSSRHHEVTEVVLPDGRPLSPGVLSSRTAWIDQVVSSLDPSLRYLLYQSPQRKGTVYLLSEAESETDRPATVPGQPNPQELEQWRGSFSKFLRRPEVARKIRIFGSLYGGPLIDPEGLSLPIPLSHLDETKHTLTLPYPLQSNLPKRYVISLKEQRNLLTENNSIARPGLLLISEALVPEINEQHRLYDQVAKGWGIPLKQAKGLVKFVPADPSRARGELKQYPLSQILYAALDAASYAEAVEELRAGGTLPEKWTILLVDQEALTRPWWLNELLNLVTNLEFYSVTFYLTAVSIDDETALLIAN